MVSNFWHPRTFEQKAFLFQTFFCVYIPRKNRIRKMYITIIMLNLFSLLNPVLNDAPEPWQIGFQDGASPTFEGIQELHNSIFFYMILISVGVAWVLGSV